MAVKTKAQILAEIASLIADNTTGDISALDMRTVFTDITDSYFDAPYKKYVALISQSGTNAPVPTILENTLGVVPVWSYGAVGEYYLDYNNAFPFGKTWIIVQQPDTNAGKTMPYQESSEDRITFYSYDALGIQANGGMSSASALTSVEIRVYP
jgi:hypothetical protein